MEGSLIGIGLFVIVCMIIFVCKEIKNSWVKNKEAKELLEHEQKEREIKIFHAQLRAKAVKIEQERAEREAWRNREAAKICQTLQGYSEARAFLYDMAFEKCFDNYQSRDEQILWESIRIVLESHNETTMESRIHLIYLKHQGMGNDSPIGAHEFRLLATHFYLGQIQALMNKIENYKTRAAKEKAKIKIQGLFEQALLPKAADTLYQNAVREGLCLYEAFLQKQNTSN